MDNEMRGQFPWSESGLRLIQEAHKMIDDNGGYENLLEIVSRENAENIYKRDTIVFKTHILKMHNKVHSKDIPGILGISESRYRAILDQMGLIGKATYRTPKIRTDRFTF